VTRELALAAAAAYVALRALGYSACWERQLGPAPTLGQLGALVHVERRGALAAQLRVALDGRVPVVDAVQVVGLLSDADLDEVRAAVLAAYRPDPARQWAWRGVQARLRESRIALAEELAP
jgi:hypothetical protein